MTKYDRFFREMTKASDSAEPFGPELKAEGLVAGRQSLRKDFITILFYN
jgi:hypothetical protein